MPNKLFTRINGSGYRQFRDADGRLVSTHRRVVEKALGVKLPSNVHVHHINENKLDNRPRNLVALQDNVHRRIHQVDGRACFRCGRSGHWAASCYAGSDFDGNELDD